MEITDLPDPIDEFARQNCWTARRCRLAFEIHLKLERFEHLIRYMLEMPISEIAAVSPYLAQQDMRGEIKLSNYAKFAPAGAMFRECRSVAFFSRLCNYPRLLLTPHGSERLFYIHGTLSPKHGMVWDWRAVDRLEEKIHRAAVMVMRCSVNSFLEQDLMYYLGLMRGANCAASTMNLGAGQGSNAFVP